MKLVEFLPQIYSLLLSLRNREQIEATTSFLVFVVLTIADLRFFTPFISLPQVLDTNGRTLTRMTAFFLPPLSWLIPVRPFFAFCFALSLALLAF